MGKKSAKKSWSESEEPLGDLHEGTCCRHKQTQRTYTKKSSRDKLQRHFPLKLSAHKTCTRERAAANVLATATSSRVCWQQSGWRHSNELSACSFLRHSPDLHTCNWKYMQNTSIFKFFHATVHYHPRHCSTV